MVNYLSSRDIKVRDPFIVPDKAAGKYYMFGTTDPDPWGGPGEGFKVFVSEDLENWVDLGYAFRPEPDFWATTNFWAPEVHQYRGSWYIFASFKADGHCRGTQILKSDALTGPYAPISDGPVTPRDWECLDGTLYVDEEEKPWIVFCHEWVQIHDGEICAMPLTEDLTAAAGEPVVLFRASEGRWCISFNKANGDYVTDGPYLYHGSNGKLCMLWSSFTEVGYAIGVAESESGSVLGPWFHRPEPVVENGGHGMIFDAFDGNVYLSIHSPNEHPLERLLLVPFEK